MTEAKKRYEALSDDERKMLQERALAEDQALRANPDKYKEMVENCKIMFAVRKATNLFTYLKKEHNCSSFYGLYAPKNTRGIKRSFGGTGVY